MRLRNVCALAMAQAGVLAMAQANALGATPVCVFDVDRTLTRPPDSTCTQPCAPSRSHLQPPTPLPSRPRKRSCYANGFKHANSSPSCGSKGTSCRQNQSRRRSVLPFPPVPPVSPIPFASPAAPRAQRTQLLTKLRASASSPEGTIAKLRYPTSTPGVLGQLLRWDELYPICARTN